MPNRELTKKEIAEAIRVKTGYIINPESVTSITAPCGGSDSLYYNASTDCNNKVQFLCRVKRPGVVVVKMITW